MAEVWLAVDLTLDRKVAVKWLKPMLATDEVVAERFRREAIAAASLNHQNIVAVHDVFEQDGRQAVVMQLVDGKSLRQLLDTQKRLSPELTCHIGACVAEALDHAHHSGFVHRDVKPGNIMITPDGRVLLTDFGIAKGLHGADEDLTSENIMMGTAKYLSPEQVRGKKLDGRADLYSLGLVLYECLAGRVPFLGETDADTALARLQRDPTDLARLRATLPSGLVLVIHQLLARNPAHRPATGSELAVSLKLAADEDPPEIDETPYERSPVAPFSAGKLVRAPSDYRGRATDRHRAVRAPAHPSMTPPSPSGPASSPLDIPGEPSHTGAATAVGNGSEPPRDITPNAGISRGAPARGLDQNTKTSMTVVGGLLLIGMVVAAVLWMTLQFGGNDPVSTTTVLPDGATDQDVAPAEAEVEPAPDTGVVQDVAPPVVPAEAASIVSITAFDPDGDSAENDEQSGLAFADGDPSTNWRTLCYSSQFMGGKRGVGLIVTLDAPAQAALSVDVANAPFQIQFFASDSDSAPPTIDAWGAPLGATAFADTAGTVVSDVPPGPATHLLVLVSEIGPDSDCTASNPYRGTIGEIRIAA
jgi:serine/threonine protein kinase